MSTAVLPGREPATGADSARRMRFGYWMPVFGGWLRNVDDEQMDASWAYTRRLAQRSEEIGFDLTLVAELFLNDIKGACFDYQKALELKPDWDMPKAELARFHVAAQP